MPASPQPPAKRVVGLTKVLLSYGKWEVAPGGEVHNMLRVRVCAAHMDGFLGPKFSRQGSLFRYPGYQSLNFY